LLRIRVSERRGRLITPLFARQILIFTQLEKDRLGMLLLSTLIVFTANIILDLQHHLYRLTLDGKLYLSPIKDDVQNVLDIGTGTGLWAIEFGSCW
jgi:hypothetical protein